MPFVPHLPMNTAPGGSIDRSRIVTGVGSTTDACVAVALGAGVNAGGGVRLGAGGEVGTGASVGGAEAT